MKLIVVLGDGETWTDIGDCEILGVTINDFDLMNDHGIYPKSDKIHPLFRVQLDQVFRNESEGM